MKSTRFRPILLCFFVAALPVSVWGQPVHSSSQPAQAAGDFNAYCAVCHGADGTGSPTGKSLNAPNLRSAAVQKQSSATLAGYIREGKEQMPAFGNQLTAGQIKAQVAYVRWLAHHKASQ